MKKLVRVLLGAALCLMLTGCTLPFVGAPNRWECYEALDATMRASFRGDVDDYEDYAGTSEGEKLYDGEVRLYAYTLMYWASVEPDYLDEETFEGFLGVARTVLAKVDWKIAGFYAVDNDKGYDGIVEVYLYPTNLLDLIKDDIQDAIEAYNEVYIDDEEANYGEIERLYGRMILEIMQSYADEARPVSEPERQLYWYAKDVEAFGEDGGIVISNTDWDEVDEVLMEIDRL